MGDFQYFLNEGLRHILDIEGFDHILFVITLCAAYPTKHWRQILLLVTAFTVGHSITLALAVLNVWSVNTRIVELLIPITILFTAVYNIFFSSNLTEKKISYNYGLAMAFGLIHGLGFSNYLKMIMMGLGDISIPLLSFNIGLELGQAAIVTVFILLLLVIERLGLSFNHRKITISILSAIITLPLIIERI